MPLVRHHIAAIMVLKALYWRNKQK